MPLFIRRCITRKDDWYGKEVKRFLHLCERLLRNLKNQIFGNVEDPYYLLTNLAE